ncbi:4-hydroxy-tetrahydrodipicolinate reductase [Pseudoalteromonas tunicata]|uniref:4-hydroxy-tetrahydrodipicolinate reductase n=1 Tax=Pseudoalteromonas tunicata D2 TaxID=87626 RepID=A4C5M4_9GAMM|nr:4-hydroxy-tetrahydrodipicolinate reductase [Pseudoalteromonas tunicata]ATC95251.1 4-hydroxy-tetrahydrodipicolinate reductase [Pseudoalteromonas tunicata]AXT30856.1 4-hydroxy-tetrahydrodipicolinate reductase [Pseudoalteromonas tunicata]EAR29278.1 dihydrodipicolinate reductase [Pseudoalteromonas tunicata D2]MDP5213154.1 4-hydroxy-tetrahydrodipicolinate reductase [Pseudoalteromonas tunicata]
MNRIGVFGANGRMGQALLQATYQDNNSEIAAAYVRKTSDFFGINVGPIIGVNDIEQTFCALEQTNCTNVDVLIDFTLPQGMLVHLAYAVANQIPMVIGTTGLTAEEFAKLQQAAKTIPIVFSRNFSVGINLLLNLVQTAAKTLSDEIDIEIFEAHHRHKIDAPSGTALAIGEAIAEAKGWDHNEVARYERHQDHVAKSQNEIGYSVLRAGDIVGEHTAYFASIGERLEITHKASSRMTFAQGAVRAAGWLKNKPAGLYDMQDVLGFK